MHNSTGISLLALLICLHARSQGRQDTGIPQEPKVLRDTTLTIYFNENSFRPDGLQLKRIDSFFHLHKGALIKGMEAHTDTIGKAVYNKGLSQQRSAAVVTYLHIQWGLAQGYPVMNYGEERPVSPDDNSLNRRVGIRVRFLAVEADRPVTAARTPGKNDTESVAGCGAVIRGDTAAGKGAVVILKKYQLDKLYFQPDEAVLESPSLSYITAMALILQKYESASFEIRGHVNCPLNVKPGSGFMAKMDQLSVDRAKLVYDLLIDQGIPASRMSYKGLGNTEMLYPYAANEEEKRKNMRVEIFVIQTSSSQPSQ
jgi:outer membrane protein OmpA-like peptidoglycan-associated protein